MSTSDRVEQARQFLQEIARANYAEFAGFGPMIKQTSDNVEALRYGVASWYLRPLYIMPNLVFVEARIFDCSRFVGCPNTPDCYLVRHGTKTARFRDYGRALLYCAIRAFREIRK